jgi:hypothetical protein
MHCKMNKKTSFYTGAVFMLAAAVSGFAQLDPIFNDGKFHPIWNKKDLTNWKDHAPNWGTEFLGTDSASIVLDGKSASGGMTHLIFNKKVTNNMEARVVMRMPTKGGANAGFQFRSRCRSATGTLENSCGGSPWQVCGPQLDLGATYSGDIYNGCSGFYVTSTTASTPPTKVNNISTCRASSNFKSVDEWNTYLVRVMNDTAWTYINGVNCTKLYLKEASEKSTGPGLIALQYETPLKVEFKTVELRNLDADTNSVSTLSARSDASGFAVQGGKASVSFKIPVAGTYSVRIADMRGQVVKNQSGTGPVAHMNLPLGASGLYLAEIRSANGSFTTKFVAD